MTVTPLGEQIVAQAQRVLEEARAIKDIASFGKDQLASPLKIGAILPSALIYFRIWCRKFTSKPARMPLYLEENYTGVLRRQLREGELDAIIVALPFTEPDVLTRPLYDENFVAVLPKNHPWNEQAQIEPQQLAEEEVLMLGEGHCFVIRFFCLLPRFGAKASHLPRQCTGRQPLETLKHMVATGQALRFCLSRRSVIWI